MLGSLRAFLRPAYGIWFTRAAWRLHAATAGATFCVMWQRSALPVFFFSSRRRHTRCSRDWSSDVCSSDLALLGDLLLRTTDRENVVLERDLHILGFDTRQLGDDADRLGILEDVHGWHPRGLGAVAVQAAQHVEDPVDDRVPLKGTSGNEHCHYSFHCRSELLLLASG